MARLGIGVRVRLDTRNLAAMRRHLDADLRGGRGPFGRALENWGDRYLHDMQQHMGAEGDGRYAPLADVTRRNRTRLGFPAEHPILVRLGLLIGGLRRGAPANLFVRIFRGVRVGYRPGTRHPGYLSPSGRRVGGGKDIHDIASAHNEGTGRLPQRRIFVTPKRSTVVAMLGDLTRALMYFRK
jgi:hypothetical protein